MIGLWLGRSAAQTCAAAARRIGLRPCGPGVRGQTLSSDTNPASRSMSGMAMSRFFFTMSPRSSRRPSVSAT